MLKESFFMVCLFQVDKIIVLATNKEEVIGPFLPAESSVVWELLPTNIEASLEQGGFIR